MIFIVISVHLSVFAGCIYIPCPFPCKHLLRRLLEDDKQHGDDEQRITGTRKLIRF